LHVRDLFAFIDTDNRDVTSQI